MPGLNFKKRFAPKVESGEKPCTIRPKRKRPIVRGDSLYLYTGMRTLNCRKLREAVCLDVQEIGINGEGKAWASVDLGGFLLGEDEKDQLARFDGFKDWHDFLAFFTEHYPWIIDAGFVGDWIVWGQEAVDWFECIKKHNMTI
jgi:hypothetical protein